MLGPIKRGVGSLLPTVFALSNSRLRESLPCWYAGVTVGVFSSDLVNPSYVKLRSPDNRYGLGLFHEQTSVIRPYAV